MVMTEIFISCFKNTCAFFRSFSQDTQSIKIKKFLNFVYRGRTLFSKLRYKLCIVLK